MSTRPIPPPLPTVPVMTPLPGDGAASKISVPWLNFFQLLQMQVQKLSRTPGPYADDPTAAANGVVIGQQYYQPNGTVMVRLV